MGERSDEGEGGGAWQEVIAGWAAKCGVMAWCVCKQGFVRHAVNAGSDSVL